MNESGFSERRKNLCVGRFAFGEAFFLSCRVEVTENLSRCKNGVKFAFLQDGNTLLEV